MSSILKPPFERARLRQDRHWSVDGLVAYYAMSEGVGQVVHDLTRYQKHGAMTNMVEANWGLSEKGRALDFDGSNDHVSLS